MKIVCNRSILANSFAMAQNAVRSNSPKPTLKNVKLEASSNEIVLFATDMEIGIRVSVPFEEIIEQGEVLLPADRVMALLKESKSEFVTIKSDNTKIVIEADSRFVFASEDPEEFPNTPVFDENNYIVTKAQYIKDAIKRTIFSTDSESGRFALAGVLMDYNESNSLNFVGTDGRRMATQHIDVSVHGTLPEEKKVVATVRSLTILDKLLQHPDADVSIVLFNSVFMIQSENVFYYASLLEGRFPEWKAAMNQLKCAKTVNFPITEFSQAVRLASIVTDKASCGIVLEFGNNQMTVSAYNLERGEMEKSFAIDYSDEKIAMKMNGNYVSEFLKTIKEETVVNFQFEDAKKGVIFNTDDGYRYLVMLMNLN